MFSRVDNEKSYITSGPGFLAERYNESLEHTKRALRHHPDNARLYFNLGNVYGKISSFEESEENFLKAIKLDPTTAQFYANFGTYSLLYCSVLNIYVHVQGRYLLSGR